jgi:hypothetical protein
MRSFFVKSEYGKRLFVSRGLAEGTLAALRDAENFVKISRGS